MNVRIRTFKVEDSKNIHKLYPDDWDFDFNSYIKNYFGKKYFKTVSLLINGQAAGFGNIIIFGEIGWLGNIVVAEKYRGKGLGTKITDELLVIGKKAGVKTFNLVATELGESVYRNLGFKKEFLYEFYHPPEKQDLFNVSDEIINVNEDHYKSIFDLDFYSTGERREVLLKSFLKNSKAIFNHNNELQGYYLSELAKGLIVAKEKDAGLELMKLMMNQRKKIVIPEKNIFAKEFLLQNGYLFNKTLPRMTLGKRYEWKPEYIFSRASGYMG